MPRQKTTIRTTIDKTLASSIRCLLTRAAIETDANDPLLKYCRWKDCRDFAQATFGLYEDDQEHIDRNKLLMDSFWSRYQREQAEKREAA